MMNIGERESFKRVLNGGFESGKVKDRGDGVLEKEMNQLKDLNGLREYLQAAACK